MSFNVQTPSRPLPGAFINTPAVNRYQSTSTPPPPIFRTNSASSTTALQQNPPQRSQTSDQSQGQVQTTTSNGSHSTNALRPLERAARTINETMMQELRFSELDGYVGQGISSDYDIPSSAAWAPFQKAKIYDVPDKVFEQFNQAQVSTLMGLFADFNHAWITIDNSLYLWDYTHPTPELVGFEDQPYNITTVSLVVPRPGVFVPAITHMLIVATTADLTIIGLSVTSNPSGGKSIALYQTGMSLSIKGMDVSIIAGSAATGRVFFSTKTDNDVYELTYQQEEKWFQNRCGKVNHTSKGLTSLTPSLLPFGTPRSTEHIVQMVVDDTRSLLYTLSSSSTIRAFQIRPQNGLELAVVQSLQQTFANLAHILSSNTPSELLAPGISIVSISPISSREAYKLHLMATTSTGCRLFFSATSSYGWSSSNSPGRLSMQVQHIKFPPPQQGVTQGSTPRSPAPANQIGQYQSAHALVDTQSRTLIRTRKAFRFPPGYFFCCAPADGQSLTDGLFVSAPDSGRIARPQDSAQTVATRYHEQGIWMGVNGHVEDIGLVSPPFAAASVPLGFGNELAVQFDEPISEIAILTNTGIHTVRRRRLVDIFAAAIRYGGGPDGLDGEVRRFIRLYGRGETTATALAVACGQGMDINPDSRGAKISDPEVIEQARKAFIEHGGKPVFNENSVVDQSIPLLDSVRPSPRHEGIALYVSRLVRSIWNAPIIRESVTPAGGLSVSSTVSVVKLRSVQGDLTKLQDFLKTNRIYIEGLAGPESLARVTTKQEEIALQAEHRALHSLTLLISDIIEGISFVLVLFDERVEEIVLSLSDSSRQHFRQLTYEGLFASPGGKDLAKDLVKAIVNRNIANGSNVDTVAEALRRRCGSFCSADDVVIFKAQEQLKKASEAGGTTDISRRLLHESLRLLRKVAASLDFENLQLTVEEYIKMQYYAGAIELCLSVAKETDRGNKALGWIGDGKPQADDREALYRSRTRVYELVHLVIVNVDAAARQSPEMIDGAYTVAAKRKAEAYQVIDSSDDEVFQFDLYDWYLSKGWDERLLAVRSPFVATYLQDKAVHNASHADLLWKYYAQKERYFDAAGVQLHLAKSDFKISLEKRIEYLSKAKANTSTNTPGVSRQGRQVLLHEISDQLDVANIQDDLLARLRADPRLHADKREQVIKHLDGKIVDLSELHNEYADQAGYFDICLLIFQAADFRSIGTIRPAWQQLIDQTHANAVEKGEARPYEVVAETVRSLGNRLNLSESTFPIPILIPMLETYAIEGQKGVGPPHWVIDVFLTLSVSYESILPTLETLFFNEEPPFTGRNLRPIAEDILYVVERWFEEGMRGSAATLLGGEENALAVAQLLQSVGESSVGEAKRGRYRELRERIEKTFR